MALIRTRQDATPLTFGHDDFEQTVEIDAVALAHLGSYRQSRPWSAEAGGQLFGSVERDTVRITEACGPFLSDERRRTSFRSDPVAAQLSIDQCSERGLLYLGEWHTHPEPRPSASMTDRDAFSRLMQRSAVRVSTLILIIQGTSKNADGVAVYSGHSSGLKQWTVKR